MLGDEYQLAGPNCLTRFFIAGKHASKITNESKTTVLSGGSNICRYEKHLQMSQWFFEMVDTTGPRHRQSPWRPVCLTVTDGIPGAFYGAALTFSRMKLICTERIIMTVTTIP